MRFGLGVYIAIEVKESLTINLYIIYDFNCESVILNQIKSFTNRLSNGNRLGKYLDTVKTQKAFR
jgi:hypothetical protein